MSRFITGCLLWLCVCTLYAQDCPTFTVDSLITTPPAACGLEDGLISVFATGTNPLGYSADGGQTFQNFSVFNGLFPGSYAIVVRDNETGCETVAGTAVISDAEGPAIDAVSIDPPTCPDGTANGSIDVSATGNDVEYSLDGGDFFFFDGNFSNLAPGSYTLVLRDGDCLTFYAENPIVLDAPDCSGGGGNTDSLQVDLNVSPATCAGDSDGSIGATVTGGEPPYTYLWSTGSTLPLLTGLAAGSYDLTVTDVAGSTTALTALLPATPPILLTLTSTPIQNGDPGGASATATNGVAPYDYSWSTGADTPDISVSTPGSYQVTVTDANGCQATDSIDVVAADCSDLTVDISEMNPSCAGDADGSVTALPGGGTPPYTYLWTTGDTTATVDGLSAANYRVTLTDAAGCTASVATALIDPFPIQFDTSVDSVRCAGQSDGAVSVQLTFAINTSILWSTGDTTAAVDNLPAGDYGLTLTNADGCAATTTLTVAEPPALDLTVTTTPTTGQTGGSATALPGGGTPPYTYDWSNGADTPTVTDLPAGLYTLNLTDANGCAAFTTFTIAGTACTLDANVVALADDCAGSGTGSATVTVSGAQGPVDILYSTGDTLATADGLTAGLYSVLVVDSAFCSVELDFSVGMTAGFTVDAVVTPESCDGDDGSIALSFDGGTAPYSVDWTGILSTTTTVSGLSANVYPVTVTDATGCSVDLTVQVPDDCTPVGCADFIAGSAVSLLVLDCDTTVAFCLPIPFFDLDEYELTSNGAPYTGDATGCAFDTTFVYAYGIVPGAATSAFEVQQWTANGSVFTGSLSNLFDILDSLAVWDPAGNWTVDTAQQLITGGQPGSTYGNLELVQASSDTVIILQAGVLRTANGSALAFGVGEHELIVTDAAGCSDTVQIEVLCADEVGSYLSVPVVLDPLSTDTLCLADLGYPADSVLVLPGGCAGAAPDPAVATVALEDNCVLINGTAPGQTSACWLLCVGTRCDTLELLITVELPGSSNDVLAVPDALTTAQAMPIVVDVLQNDSIQGNVVSVEVSLDALNGNTAVLPDLSINYVPDPEFCGVDSFRYTVCTATGCGSAFVTVTVLCNNLVIYDGFSPNDDGVNDAFTIQGLNSFDGHTLYVYNRWGNLVLESRDYQNDWRGTYDGRDLPPGVYFYLLRLDGEDEPRAGAVTLHR